MAMIIRPLSDGDIPQVTEIYNEGIEDRIATLEDKAKSVNEVSQMFMDRSPRYGVLVAKKDDQVLGWAAINPYSHRWAYAGVGEVSIYIKRKARGQGVGKALLRALEGYAIDHDFYKLVLFTFARNLQAQGLYRACGFSEVGIFRNQGILDGQFIDILAMEKIFGWVN